MQNPKSLQNSEVKKQFITTLYNPFNDPKMVMSLKCPTCGALAETKEAIEIIMGLGECLRCDHVRGEIQDEWKSIQVSEEEMVEWGWR